MRSAVYDTTVIFFISRLFDIIQTLIEVVERFVPGAAAVGKSPIFPELQEEALGQFLHRLLQGGKELLIGEALCGGAFLESIDNQGFRHLIQRIHFEMHPYKMAKIRQDRYDRAIEWLKGVMKGDITIDGAPLIEEPELGDNSPWQIQADDARPTFR